MITYMDTVYILCPHMWGQSFGPFGSFDKAQKFAVDNGLVATHYPLTLIRPHQEEGKNERR